SERAALRVEDLDVELPHPAGPEGPYGDAAARRDDLEAHVTALGEGARLDRSDLGHSHRGEGVVDRDVARIERRGPWPGARGEDGGEERADQPGRAEPARAHVTPFRGRGRRGPRASG